MHKHDRCDIVGDEGPLRCLLVVSTARLVNWDGRINRKGAVNLSGRDFVRGSSIRLDCIRFVYAYSACPRCVLRGLIATCSELIAFNYDWLSASIL